MAQYRLTSSRSLGCAPGTRLLAVLLCLALLLGVQPIPEARAATLTVNTTDDVVDADGCDATHCSLREAISDAVAGDVIGFSVSGTITLASGELGITKDLTISGPGESALTISGDNRYRVFYIEAANVAISGLTIAQGIGGNGGGMANRDSAPALTNVTFRGNFAVQGGGMYNFDSSPTLTNVTFRDNVATDGGGMYNEGGSPALTNVTFWQNDVTHRGGGMFNHHSNPSLANVEFTYNFAFPLWWYPPGGGGGMYNYMSSPTLVGAFFGGNMAEDDGGGMVNDASSNPVLTDVEFLANGAYKGGGMFNKDSSPTLTNVMFDDNHVTYGGGGMYNTDESNPALTDVTFRRNETGREGGGMCNAGSNPTLESVAFIINSADTGGGMHNSFDSSPSLTGVIFNSNTANAGGGMANSDSNPELTTVTFSGNSAQDGGGMYNEGGSPALTNVTFSGNSASWQGGGMWNSNDSGPTLTYVTISGNSADLGGGIYSMSINTPTLTSTILAGNSAGTSGPDCYGTISSGGFNLIGDSTDCTIVAPRKDRVGTALDPIDPRLAPLADNGGETQTRSLMAGSPALGRIPFGVNGCGTDVTTDQRGQERPYPAGRRCDIGAYESGPGELPDTGFAPGRVTRLPVQPAEKAYTNLGSLWLEVPSLGVQAPIVSVPLVGSHWDVSWLGDRVGYLQGTAFPTWEGNTVLTGHVWDAYNRPGLFADLKELQYGDRVEIHAWGSEYVYEVRENRLIPPDAVDLLLQHRGRDWVTLFTCESYRWAGDTYAYRRMVRAVLVDVGPDT